MSVPASGHSCFDVKLIMILLSDESCLALLNESAFVSFIKMHPANSSVFLPGSNGIIFDHESVVADNGKKGFASPEKKRCYYKISHYRSRSVFRKTNTTIGEMERLSVSNGISMKEKAESIIKILGVEFVWENLVLTGIINY